MLVMFPFHKERRIIFFLKVLVFDIKSKLAGRLMGKEGFKFGKEEAL